MQEKNNPIKAHVLLPPSVVYTLYQCVIREWPANVKNLPPEILKNPKRLGNEFEDVIHQKIPTQIYRTWMGRGKPLHGKSCVPNEHDVIIYRWDGKEFPIIFECKVRKNGLIEIDHLRAFNAKVTDIYYTYHLEYSRSLNVEFKDVYRVFVTNSEIEHRAIFYALAYGMLPIGRKCPNLAVAIHKMENLLRPRRLKELKRSGFYQELYRLYGLTFRGYKKSLREVLSGAHLYERVKAMYDAVESMTG